MVMESGRETTETAAFTRALAALKRRGSNLLVVGATAADAHTAACDRLLGDGHADRTRVFVTTDGNCGAHAGATRTADDHVVEYATATRGSAVASASSTGGPSLADDVSSVTVDDLGSLGEAMSEVIEDADGVAPAELRVCFDSLGPLLEEYDEQEMFRFLHALTSEVRSVRGMGHYHLPVRLENRTVRTLRPLFDAVVEIRTQGGEPQQRWHLNEADITTDWLGL